MERKNARKAITAAVLFFIFIPLAYADTVQLDLFSIGCPSLFDPNHSWSSNIDLGVQFSQIDSVYIDWAGGITAGLAQYFDPITFEPIGDPVPKDVSIAASLGSNPSPRATNIWGGEPNYPAPEPFNSLSKFNLFSDSSWSDLLDGQGTITIGYGKLIMINGTYIEDGFITLTNATLVVDGTIVPEPATILLLTAGIIIARRKSFKKSHNFQKLIDM
jgi:hypothetical protein